MEPYVRETFTPEERSVLERYVTDTSQPVFALRNLPEVVKGALFARYSRSPKSLRRLLLDEFAADLAEHAGGVEEQTRHARAERLYERVFSEYGDDSVAQLGGAHVAVEQASNLLTKVLEWGRLGAYLEQSTRYIPYDDKPGGRYRYYRDPDVLASPHGRAYVETMDAVFDAYAACLPRVEDWARRRFPQDEHTSDAVYRSSIRAKACDLLRGLLPAATVSNVGIFASGQAYEALLLRLQQHELAEARHVYGLLLASLREVIPSFVARVDRPDRGVAWAAWLGARRDETRAIARRLLAEDEVPRAAGAGTRAAGRAATGSDTPSEQPEVALVAFSPDAEVELVTGMLYPHTHLSEERLRAAVARMDATERADVLRAYAGGRENRRHRPGRALERVWYRFDVCSDYGAFRDLQRHRMLTIEWQQLSPVHGYDTPPELVEAGVADDWHAALARQEALWRRLVDDFPAQAQYAVGFAWRIRYSMQLNARAAMQMLELRTTPQGHPSYRRVCQRMHELIRDEAGHTAIADMMRFVDHGAADLERLEAERRMEARRLAREGR